LRRKASTTQVTFEIRWRRWPTGETAEKDKCAEARFVGDSHKEHRTKEAPGGGLLRPRQKRDRGVQRVLVRVYHEVEKGQILRLENPTRKQKGGMEKHVTTELKARKDGRGGEGGAYEREPIAIKTQKAVIEAKQKNRRKKGV